MKARIDFRWVVCGLLFFATTVNYLDRQVLSLTWKDFIAPEFGWTDNHYGVVTGYFGLIYAVCMLFAGKIVDWLGTKKGYLWAIGVWSVAACLHALCGVATAWCTGLDGTAAFAAIQKGSALAVSVGSVSMWLFLGCRCLLALGEAGNFPAAIRATANYFEPKDRAFATSVFNAGSSIGALVAPLVIPPIAKAWGWEMAFIGIGALGFVWMGFWQFLYPAAARPVLQAATVSAGQVPTTLSYRRCFTLRPTWSLLLGRFLTDGVWWFFLFWTPGYLSDRFGYKSSSGTGMVMIAALYAIATLVSIVLCKIPTWFVDKKGMKPYDGRMASMFIFACLPLVALGAQPLGAVSAWWPVVLIGLACAGHMAWSANIFSVVGDLFPRELIGMLTGVAGLACGLSSFLFNRGAGWLFTYAGKAGDSFGFLGYTGKDAGYMIVFCVCAVAYLAGWICMKALVPRVPAEVEGV